MFTPVQQWLKKKCLIITGVQIVFDSAVASCLWLPQITFKKLFYLGIFLFKSILLKLELFRLSYKKKKHDSWHSLSFIFRTCTVQSSRRSYREQGWCFFPALCDWRYRLHAENGRPLFAPSSASKKVSYADHGGDGYHHGSSSEGVLPNAPFILKQPGTLISNRGLRGFSAVQTMFPPSPNIISTSDHRPKFGVCGLRRRFARFRESFYRKTWTPAFSFAALVF